ncbi:MAG: M24 family metallopeptidase [Candidatus Bathyarchaeia archaeon]
MIDVHRQRFEKAEGLMREREVDGLFLFPGPNIGYLTGFRIDPSERLSAAIIPFEGEPALVVPGLERGLRGQKPWIKDVLTWDEQGDPIDLVVKTLRERGLDEAKIGLEEHVWWGVINKIQRRLPKVGFVDVSEEIYSLRMVKSEEELAWMRKACEVSDRALRIGFESLHKGMTELQLASTISAEMTRLGGSPHLGIVLFGARTALPHGQPGEQRLKRGDGVLVDTGTTWNGYWSDITRTLFFGEPSERHRRIWSTVLEANRAAFAAAAPGVRCEDVDRAARRVINEAGFGEYFIHRLGHGIGLQGHEHPYMVEGNGLELRPRVTFTIEPGIYIVGDVGIRIEDTAVCTELGCESLTEMEREMTIP